MLCNNGGASFGYQNPLLYWTMLMVMAMMMMSLMLQLPGIFCTLIPTTSLTGSWCPLFWVKAPSCNSALMPVPGARYARLVLCLCHSHCDSVIHKAVGIGRTNSQPYCT